MKTQRIDLSGFVNASGRPIINDPQSPSFKAAQRVTREPPKSFHKGFSVVGFAPGVIASAEAQATDEVRAWAALPEDSKAKQLAEGRRPPKPFDRASWIAKTKPQRVRNRPFEIPAAADECAELARRAGWEEVRVEALTKGDAAQAAIL